MKTTIGILGLCTAFVSACTAVPVPVSVGSLAPGLLPQAPPYQTPLASIPILPMPAVMPATIRTPTNSYVPPVSEPVITPPDIAAEPVVTPPSVNHPPNLPVPVVVKPVPTQNVATSNAEALREVADRIFKNETQGDTRKLLRWNQQGNFTALGIGHLVWYPAGRRGSYTETFPAFLNYARANQVAIPSWLVRTNGTPWTDQASFERAQTDGQMAELRDFLQKTLPLQARFMADSLRQRMPNLVQSLPPDARNHVMANYQIMEKTPGGLYPVLDYVHFQGDGANPNERYRGQGWGLLQVLQGMEQVQPGNDALAEFMRAANDTLVVRVANAPSDRREARMLDAWEGRVRTYKVPTRIAYR